MGMSMGMGIGMGEWVWGWVSYSFRENGAELNVWARPPGNSWSCKMGRQARTSKGKPKRMQGHIQAPFANRIQRGLSVGSECITVHCYI